MPMSRFSAGSLATSRPSKRIEPPSASSKPAMIFRVVVLPHPDGPSKDRNSPWPALSDRSSTALTAPYILVSDEILTSVMRGQQETNRSPSGSSGGTPSVIPAKAGIQRDTTTREG